MQFNKMGAPVGDTNAKIIVSVICGLTNIFLIAVSIVLLTQAIPLQGFPTRHGDQWVTKLIIFSIVGICVGTLHTIYIPFFFYYTRNMTHESTKLRNARIYYCLVQIVAMVLILLTIIIPGVDQWPTLYLETNLVMIAGICFIAFNIPLAVIVGIAACQKQVPVPYHVTNA